MDNKKLAMIGALAIVALVAGIFLGYSIKVTPVATAASDSNQACLNLSDHVYTMSANGTTVEMKKGTTFLIALPENGGSTGYLWDITSTQGLDVPGSWFVPGSKGMIGEPGIREWMITASWPGEQHFKATLKQPWTTTSGDETVFTLTVNVIE